MNGQQSYVRARVYRNLEEGIVILWNKRFLTEDQKKNYTISIVEKDESDKPGAVFRQIKVVDPKSLSVKGPQDPDVEMIMIPHRLNELSPETDYIVKVVWGSLEQKQIEFRLKVYGSGVLPPDERDDSKRNQHGYGYVHKRRKWVKMPLVEWNGQFALPVVIVNADEVQKLSKRVIPVSLQSMSQDREDGQEDVIDTH